MEERFKDTRCFIAPNVPIERVFALHKEGIRCELQEINFQSEIDLAVAEERKRIVEEMKSWTNQNYRRSTEPLYAWVSAKDLIEQINLITTK